MKKLIESKTKQNKLKKISKPVPYPGTDMSCKSPPKYLAYYVKEIFVMKSFFLVFKKKRQRGGLKKKKQRGGLKKKKKKRKPICLEVIHNQILPLELVFDEDSFLDSL